MGSFTFNGVSSTTHGLRVTSDYIISSTGSDVETVAVPGRDGDLLISKNRLKSVTIELPVPYFQIVSSQMPRVISVTGSM